MTQRELSAKLGRSHNFIVKIETGARGVYVVDLIDIIRELGKPIRPALDEYTRLLAETNPLSHWP
jgi:transcriptional regulator with XRE-family HTH domain